MRSSVSKRAIQSSVQLLQGPRAWWRLQPANASDQLGQQFIVRLMLIQGGNERFHRFNRVQIHHGPAELAHRFDLVFREELLLLAGPTLGDVDRSEESRVRELAIQNQLHVAGAFELLERSEEH